MGPAKVSIYPAFNARYYSPYIMGLRRMLGPSRLTFTRRGFPRFDSDCLAIRIQGEDEVRIYIHSNDMPELSSAGLDWADVFGKVNLDSDLVPTEHRGKVFALGPMFPVKVWGRGWAEVMGLYSYLLSRGASEGFRRHVGNYRGQYRSRFSEAAYHPGDSDPSYLFFNAAVWERESDANIARARFVEAARLVPGLSFEGGLTPRHSARGSETFNGSEFSRYFSKRFPPDQYLENTRRSVVAFNNPAYRDCHSWRLAEYLALGKAIISTPIVRALPAPLVHGTHIHYVDGSVEAIREAIARISRDTEYRRALETEARRYYDTYLSPEKVIERTLCRMNSKPGAKLNTDSRH